MWVWAWVISQHPLNATWNDRIDRYFPNLRVLRASLLDAARQLGHLVVGGLLFRHLLVDLLVGVHHGGVVAPAEDVADLGKGE